MYIILRWGVDTYNGQWPMACFILYWYLIWQSKFHSPVSIVTPQAFHAPTCGRTCHITRTRINQLPFRSNATNFTFSITKNFIFIHSLINLILFSN